MALLVGGVGIANVMVISVLERRSEIGLRRALGATRRHISTQFLTESVLLCDPAAGSAVSCSGALGTFVYCDRRKDQTTVVPPIAIAGGMGSALGDRRDRRAVPVAARRAAGADRSPTSRLRSCGVTALMESTDRRQQILVVDDDERVRSSLLRALGLEAYSVTTPPDGQEALERLQERGYDAIVLDVTMPVLDGIEVVPAPAAAGDRMPVLMLTARDAVDDRVAGLDAGADDYLVKPFALQEFFARLRAIMRRASPAGEGQRSGFADLALDQRTYEVHRGERKVDLTRTEYRLLELLLEHPRQVLERSTIFERVWGYDFGATSNSLGVYVGYLRRKLEEGGEPRLLHTVRGVGYVLRGGLSAAPPADAPDGARGGRDVVVIASVLAYFAVAHQLRGEVDDSLRGAGRWRSGSPSAARTVRRSPRSARAGPRRIRRGRAEVAPRPAARSRSAARARTAQIVTLERRRRSGRVGRRRPRSRRSKLYQEVAAGERGADVHRRGRRRRAPARLRAARRRRARVRLGAHGRRDRRRAGPVALAPARRRRSAAPLLAALLGRAVADASIGPITRLEEGARHVARHQRPDAPHRRSAVRRRRRACAIQFNTMLEALERSAAALGASVESQRRLIADTSHELRTPITSLRTNIEVLHSIERLDAGRAHEPAERGRGRARGARRR